MDLTYVFDSADSWKDWIYSLPISKIVLMGRVVAFTNLLPGRNELSAVMQSE